MGKVLLDGNSQSLHPDPGRKIQQSVDKIREHRHHGNKADSRWLTSQLSVDQLPNHDPFPINKPTATSRTPAAGSL